MASGFSAPKKDRAKTTGPVSGSGADGKGLTIANYYTKPDKNPFDSIKWQKRTAKITNEKGEIIFEQKNIEMPSFWSQTALNVVASKYFNGKLGTPQRESSVKQLINRVSETLSDWGREDGYFATEADAATFYHELTHILINQKATFNSPVWFNCGIEEKPQCSACFINSVKDSMPSILDLAKTEGMLFKWGSGAGSNLSAIRSSKEKISGGGTASSIFFQNANHSVRVSDEFMKALVEDKKWQTIEINSGNVADSYRAKDLMKMIAEAAWLSGDPGIQFDTMINDWHTCLNTDRI